MPDYKSPYRDRKCGCGAIIKTKIIECLTADGKSDVYYPPPEEYCVECGTDLAIEFMHYDVQIKKRHERMGFENFKAKTESQKSALKELSSYESDGGTLFDRLEETKSDNPGVFLHGPVGAGKTHLAVSLATRIISDLAKSEGVRRVVLSTKKPYERNPSKFVLFVSAVNLLYEIKQTFDENCSISTDEVIEKYSKARFLVLDDLGVEKGSEWTKEVLYLIINNRYESCYPTIVTTNYAPMVLAQKLGKRLVSRLLHNVLVIKLDGEDYRPKDMGIKDKVKNE